jgi:hypothetical protein
MSVLEIATRSIARIHIYITNDIEMVLRPFLLFLDECVECSLPLYLCYAVSTLLVELRFGLVLPTVLTWPVAPVNFSRAIPTSSVPPGIEHHGDRQAIADGESSAEVAAICTSSSSATFSRTPIVQGSF